MPRFNTDDMNNYQGVTGHFGFSGQKPEKLGASEYTLFQISVDDSASVKSFQIQLEQCVKNAVEACQKSPRSDFLMVRLVKFSDQVEEVHGWKMLSEIDLSNYSGFLGRHRTTALFDACDDGLEAVFTYGTDLFDKDYTTNGLFVLITDGQDVGSRFSSYQSIRDNLDKIRKSEKLESIKTILVGVNINDAAVSRALNELTTEVKFDQYVELDKADAKTLAKLADFISKSVSASTSAKVSGGPSKNLNF